ncbi:hypothetical protein LY28_00704 [Ruminiclostridium sufflavum DSM 19573]|uniref:Uncharacterized protein n=1 Tax=Ruminiclostridium sufflavum DSM 19573 TaxID=1121337 RepID=A0A318XQL1_9FIRM|nr:hypothetical protein [Ruminiclostridium sufflavum]PYG89485.1 hypothetical protein LY28_00704 [Ruminiclostridium sufflavum DSM 19573]
MKEYVKPSMEVIRLRPEEGIAHFGSDSGGEEIDVGSIRISFWFLCDRYK